MTNNNDQCELTDKRVTVVGLGRFGGGIGVTRWLAKLGAKVTVSDKASGDELSDSIRKLEGLDVALHLGSHDEKDFLDTDLLIVSPAIPKDVPQLKSALSRDVAWTTEINLFLQRCTAPIVGVTGTVGKSTTTSMLGQILSQKFTTHVGGNIGLSLLESLDEIAPSHVVVLELSSFQLEDIPQVGISPKIALVTNIAPNHLDRHKTFDNYASAKKNIFRFQKGDDVLLLNRDCKALSDWSKQAPARVEFFDPGAEPFELTVPGRHNQANAQAAWSAAIQLGVDRQTATVALRTFTSLPHRLQFVTERDSVRYYNDSKCTTPQGTIVAMEAFEPGSVIVIVGGYDNKSVSFDSLGKCLAQRAKAVITLGATSDKIIESIEKHRTQTAPTVQKAQTLPQAVSAAKKLSSPQTTILLSPACASYDMFTNYEHRGNNFVEIVTDL